MHEKRNVGDQWNELKEIKNQRSDEKGYVYLLLGRIPLMELAWRNEFSKSVERVMSCIIQGRRSRWNSDQQSTFILMDKHAQQ